MRLLVAGFGVVVLAGCGENRRDVVGRVDARTLSVERLAELMVLAQPVPVTTEVAHELAHQWIQWTVLAARGAAGDSMMDSASVLRAMWYPVRQEIVTQWRARLLERAGLGGDPDAVVHFDSSYGARLWRAKNARVLGRAPATARAIAGDPWTRSPAPDTLATFVGGGLLSADLARHVRFLSPGTRREMMAATDARITDFLSGMVLQELMWRQADSAGVRLSETSLRAIDEQYRDALRTAWRHAGLAPAALAGAGVSIREREQLGARRVEEYLDAAAARRIELMSLPPFLAVALLGDADWEIRPQGLLAAVERAERLLDATRR